MISILMFCVFFSWNHYYWDMESPKFVFLPLIFFLLFAISLGNCLFCFGFCWTFQEISIFSSSPPHGCSFPKVSLFLWFLLLVWSPSPPHPFSLSVLFSIFHTSAPLRGWSVCKNWRWKAGWVRERGWSGWGPLCVCWLSPVVGTSIVGPSGSFFLELVGFFRENPSIALSSRHIHGPPKMSLC